MSRFTDEFSPRTRSKSRAESKSDVIKELVTSLELDIPEFDEAAEIIDQNRELAYQDIKFNDPSMESSIAYFLTYRYHTFNHPIKISTCRFLDHLNNICPNNEVFKDIKETIYQLTERDKENADTYQLLIDLINTVDLSDSEDSESATPEEIAEEIIQECIDKFDDEDFNVNEAIHNLVQETMKFGKAISFEELTDIVANIEKTLVEPKDPRWQNFRFTMGNIVNITADHYIAENKRVDRNQKLLLLLCLTIIGIIVPILHYNLVVKKTRNDSPLVVFEMDKNTFEEATMKNAKTQIGKAPRASYKNQEESENNNNEDSEISVVGKKNNNRQSYISGKTVHRLWISSISRRLTEPKQTPLISGKGNLKRTVLFSSDASKNNHLFNGVIPANTLHSEDAKVRWIVLRGEQAERTIEKLEDEDYEIVLGAAAA